MNKLILPLFFLILFGQTGQSQTLKAWIKAADEAFVMEDYYSAFKYYEIALEFDTTRVDLWYKFAESAREFTAFHRAEEAYQMVLASSTASQYPMLKFWLAQTKQQLGQYDAAKQLYEAFLNEQPRTRKEYKNAASKGIEDCDWALERIYEPDDSILIRNLGAKVNSEYSDFAPALVGDTLYYSSFKFVFQKDTLNPPRTRIKIMNAVGSNGKGYPLPDGEFNLADKHVAHTAFTIDYRQVYYTVCDYIGETKDIRCEIYTKERTADGSWTPGYKLDFNQPGYTYTHPNVGFDSETNEEYLYFVSDQPKGEGQLDIWRSRIKKNGNLEEPENLKDLNTEGNEITPFFHAFTRTLYFSTDGYHTLGGYDIYQTQFDGKRWSTPDHLDVPINTSYNDLYYSPFEYGSKVFFASNRPDSAAVFWDKTKDACCNDLYTFNRKVEIEFLASTFNFLDTMPLDGTQLKIYEQTPEGEKLVAILDNPEGNNFTYPLEPNKLYKIEATKDSFSVAVDTVDLRPLKPMVYSKIEKKLYLEPYLYLEALTFRKLDSLALVGGGLTIYEIVDGEERLLDSLRLENRNDFSIPVLPGRQYLLKVEKEGFYPIREFIDLTQPDLPKIGKIERRLYMEPPPIGTDPQQAPLYLDALTFRLADSLALEASAVALYEIVDGKEVLIDSIFNPDSNNHLFGLKPGKKYILKGYHDGFYPVTDTLDLSHPKYPKSGKIEHDLYLEEPAPLYLDALTYKLADSLALAGSSVALYEIVDGKEVLMDSMFNASGNSHLFPLESGKKYILKGYKDGFYPVTDTLDLSKPEFPKSGKIERDLYLDQPGPLYLDALTFKKADSLALAGSSVALYQIIDGQEVLIDSLFNPDGNSHLFPLEPGQIYVLKGYRDGFYPIKDTLDLSDPELYPRSGKIERDLYLSQPGPLYLEALTYKRLDSLALVAGGVALYDITDGKEQLIDSLYNKGGNDFLFPIETGKLYVIKGTKEGFYPITDTLDTRPRNPGFLYGDDNKIERELYLAPPLQLRTLTFTRLDSLALPGSAVTLVDITDGQERLLDSLSNPTGNDFVFELSPYRDYVIKGIHDGYYPRLDSLKGVEPNPDGPTLIERELFLTPPLKINALTYNRLDSLALTGTALTIYEIDGVSEKLLDSLTSPVNNEFILPPLDPNKQYVVKVWRDDFLPVIDTISVDDGLEVEKKFYLPIPEITWYTYDEMDSLALDGTTLYIFDITGSQERLLDSLTNPRGNDFLFKLDPNRDYVIKAYKADYHPMLDTLRFTSLPLNKIPTLERRLNLAPQVVLDVGTFHLRDSSALNGTTVYLYDITGDTPVLLDSLTADNEDNLYFFKIQPNKKYVIHALKDGFEPVLDSLDLTGPAKDFLGPIKRDLYLDRPAPKAALEAFTFNAEDKTPLDGVTVKLLRILDGGVVDTIDIRTNVGGNDFFYELDPNGGTYIIMAEKDGFLPLTDTLNITPGEIERQGGKVRVDLYLQRESLDDFLPLALYFDNDYPDPRTWRTSTNKEYLPTNEAYYGKKQEFIEEFTEGLSPNDKYRTTRSFDSFFEREVKEAATKLTEFTTRVAQYLKDGRTVKMTIQGYCSPRGATKYNELLSHRRINSVKNHFMAHNGGELKKYIDAGQLSFKEEAYGESKADVTQISDAFNDPKNSIFSLVASAERRVQIEDVVIE